MTNRRLCILGRITSTKFHEGTLITKATLIYLQYYARRVLYYRETRVYASVDRGHRDDNNYDNNTNGNYVIYSPCNHLWPRSIDLCHPCLSFSFNFAWRDTIDFERSRFSCVRLDSSRLVSNHVRCPISSVVSYYRRRERERECVSNWVN